MSLSKDLTLSTDMVDPYVRNDWWRSISDVLYTVTPANPDPKAKLTGYVRSQPFGRMIFGSTAFNSQYAVRTRRMIVRDDMDVCVLQLIIAGDYHADFGDINTIVRPGDIFFLDLTQPLDSFKEAGSRLSVVIPRSDLTKVIKRQNFHGVVLRRELTSTRLIANYMIGAHKMIESTDEDEIERVQDSLLSLIAIAFNAEAPDDINRNGLQLPLRQRVLDYIDRNVTDTNLSVELLMKNFRVSRSHLYRAFEDEGGIIKIIQEKRLDLAYRLLANTGAQSNSIKEIVYQCGFPSVGSFIRIFKVRFGVTPSEVRNSGTPSTETQHETFVLHKHLFELADRMKLYDTDLSADHDF